MDKELKDLFVEIRTKNWEQELESFRHELQMESINKKRFSIDFLFKYSQLFIPIFVGLVLGTFISPQTALVLYIIELIILCISLSSLKYKFASILCFFVAIFGGVFLVNSLASILAMSTFSLVFRSMIGGGLGILLSWAMLSRYNLELFEVLPFLKSFELQEDFPLEADELLRFWESKMGVYIEKKQVDLKDRLKSIYQKKEEINHLLLELNQYNDSSDLEVKKNLQTALRKAQSTENDLVNITETLHMMKEGFLHKISQLKSLVEEKKLLEERQQKRKTLHLRISQALSYNEKETTTWELEKKEMQIELRSIMNVFRDQILQSGDFFQAQMDLVEQKGNQIDE